jgi:PBP1b-binding outer membrane lipoprotein LpoB
MKNLWHVILILIIMSLLAGCATNPPKDESKENPEKWQKDIEIIQPRR